MRISFNQRWEKSANINGFGYAREMCEKSLVNLGHTVGFADPHADIEINFIQPQHFIWSGKPHSEGGPLRIGYVPWESTRLQPARFLDDGSLVHRAWVNILNETDEVWTPSAIVAEWMKADGVEVPIFVYEHGVEEVWSPLRRTYHNPLNVFHPDLFSIRKNAMAVAQVLRKPDGAPTALGARANVVMKTIDGTFDPKLAAHMGINMLPEKLPIHELVGLYHMQHLMVYPTAGEGFGLSPIQALATGMPTIVTKGWSPYENLFPQHALVESSLVEVPNRWQFLHPGKWFEPDLDSLASVIEWHLQPDNYEKAAKETYELATSGVFDEWRWDVKTAEILEHLI